MVPTTTPMGWWSRAMLLAMQDLLADPVATWAGEWLPAGLAPSVRCVLAWESVRSAESAWRGIGSATAGTAWIDSEAGQAVAGWLFGSCPPQPGSIAEAVAQRALEALLERIRKPLRVTSACSVAPPASLFRPWSGGVVATIEGPGAFALSLLVDGECFASSLPNPPVRNLKALPLVRVDDACSGQAIRVRVRLAPLDVDIGTLGTLRVGDVLAAAHRLDQPMQVALGDESLCNGYLGQSGGRRAVEFARSDGTTAST